MIALSILGFAGVAFAAPFFSSTRSMVPESDTVNNNLGTTSPSNLRYNGFFKDVSISGTCTGCGGSSGTVSTSTNETQGFLPYWTTTSGTPAKLGQVATTTLTGTAPITFSQPISVIGATPSVITCAVASGSLAGCLSTADWTTFNNKLGSYDAWTHPSATTFATTTSALSLPNSGFVGFMGNAVVDTSNYSLFGNTTLTLLNARSGASIGFRIANVDVANFTTTGGFGFGSTYYNLDPGQNNMIVEGRLGVASSTPWKQLSIGSSNVGTFAISTTTGGCAQFSVSGELFSTGTNCALGGLTSYDAWTHPDANTSATTTPLMSFVNASTTQITSTGSAYLATVSGKVGVATTTPWGLLSVNPNALGAGVPQFVVGSSTATSLLITNSGALILGTSATQGITKGFLVNVPTGTIGIGTFSKTQLTNEEGGLLTFAGGTNGDTVRGYQGFTHTGSGADTFFTGELADAMAIRSEGAFQLGTNGNNIRLTVASGGNVGVATSTPWGLLSINPNALGANVPSFVIGSSTATRFIVNGAGNVGIATTTPNFRLSLGTTGSDFYITSGGKVVSYDTANAWGGVDTPTKRHGFSIATSTATWNATSTPGVDISGERPMDYAGTIRSVTCKFNTFLGVNIQINTTKLTPAYFIASSTSGTITFTANNTFVKGDYIWAQVGTTTSATSASGVVRGSCVLNATETP